MIRKRRTIQDIRNKNEALRNRRFTSKLEGMKEFVQTKSTETRSWSEQRLGALTEIGLVIIPMACVFAIIDSSESQTNNHVEQMLNLKYEILLVVWH